MSTSGSAPRPSRCCARDAAADAGADAALSARLIKLATALRRLIDQDLEETVSTRLLVVAARLIVSGLPPLTACRAAIVDALTDDLDTASALDQVVQARVEGKADVQDLLMEYCKMKKPL